MKQFFKYVLATICGILILVVASGILFMISVVGMIASSSSTTSVKENSVFLLKMNGTIEERSEESSPLDMLMGGADMSAMGLDDILSAIKKAKEQDDIKGIYLEGGLSQFDSPATAQQIRDALKDFKQSGKWIVAYADQYMQSSYYVASVADKIFLNKTGMIDLKGLGGLGEYYKGLYDKLGIKYQAVRVGKYKSYVERNTMTGMSDNDREQRTAYTQGIWQHWLKDIAESRKLEAIKIDQMVSDSIIGLANPEDYIKARLVDKLMYADEVRAEVQSLLKLDKDDDINQLTLDDMLNVPTKQKEKGDEVAVYYAYGEIVDNAAFSLFSGHSIIGDKTVAELNELAKDDDVKAVVLRVNSPGGSAVASEKIWHAVKQLKAKKPVVVSMGGMAASGGYMISAAANYIYAEPTTITGSIGIFGLIPNFSGLMTDKLGITFDGVKTNKYTDFEEKLTMGKDNAEELRFMQTYVDRGYETFLSIVGDGRKMSRDSVNEIAQGRVWLATDALGIKLVDKLGSLDDAVKKAAELAKLDEYHPKNYPAPASWMDQLLSSEKKKGSNLDGELRAVLGEFYEPFLEMRRDQLRDRLQARLPYSVRIK